jgi:hypothetical protein
MLFRRLGFGLVVLAALAGAPSALAAYPSPLAEQGGLGVLGSGGATRFVALAAAGGTVVAKIGTADGTLRGSRAFDGSFGIPVLVPGSSGDAISRDGSFLVLQSTGLGPRTELMIVSTRDLSTLDTIRLDGSFAYDALSPDGTTLYLIQHTSVNDLEHYVVRAYDLDAHTLLPGRIADKSQKTWLMQGFPMTRTTSADGRWVFTLYQNPGGYPFIHALDTVRAVAHCIGLPWTSANQAPLGKAVLSLHGTTLAVGLKKGGTPWLNVSTATWKTTPAPAAGGFPWLWPAFGAGAAAVAALAVVVIRRRRTGGAMRVSPA